MAGLVEDMANVIWIGQRLWYVTKSCYFVVQAGIGWNQMLTAIIKCPHPDMQSLLGAVRVSIITKMKLGVVFVKAMLAAITGCSRISSMKGKATGLASKFVLVWHERFGAVRANPERHILVGLPTGFGLVQEFLH